MKKILTFFTIVYLASCGQVANIQDGGESNTDTLKTKTDLQFDDNVLNDIKKYYQNEYGQDTRVDEQITDSTIEITYYNIPKANDEYDGFLIGITISKNNDKQLFGPTPIMYGDLNNDNLRDLVVSVHTEGGGTGGNKLWWNDLFVFLNQKDKLILASVTPDQEISGCNIYGHFTAKKIDNGYLIGNSSCYGEDDAFCCPSLNYITKVSLSKDTLVFHSKDKIK